MATKRQYCENNLIAVGVEFDPANLRCVLEQHGFFEISPRIMAGVWYSQKSKQVSDAIKSDADLNTWFVSRRQVIHYVYISKLYWNRKKTLVVGEITCGNEKIFAFIVNADNVSTSQVKKLILSGKSGFETATFDRITMPAKVYKHSVDPRIVIEY
jgi:hypothetical protein